MEYELYHYGRKGMKWYQNIFTKHKERVAAKKKRKAEKEKAEAEKRKVDVAEQKEKIRNSRSAEQVYKNAHLFTDKELNEIYNRLNTENNIKKLIPEKVNKGKKFVEKVADTTQSIGTLVNNTTTMVNKFKDFGKLFGGDAKSAKSAPKSADNTNKSKSKDSTNKVKDKSKSKNGKVEKITNFDIIDRASKNTSSRDAWRTSAKSISENIDYSSWARAMTRDIGSRTVNAAKNNYDRISSGTDFVSGMLGLPVPDDD